MLQSLEQSGGWGSHSSCTHLPDTCAADAILWAGSLNLSKTPVVLGQPTIHNVIHIVHIAGRRAISAFHSDVLTTCQILSL